MLTPLIYFILINFSFQLFRLYERNCAQLLIHSMGVFDFSRFVSIFFMDSILVINSNSAKIHSLDFPDERVA